MTPLPDIQRVHKTFMSIPDLCQWLQSTPWGIGIRESTLAFPIIEGTHAISIALSVGILLIMDLGLAGVLMRRESSGFCP